MEPSKYQEAIYTHFRARGGNAAVISTAGSGKTTTALDGIGQIPKFFSVLLGAFNKDIRLDFEAKGKAKGYKNVKYTTYNGFGWGICLNAMKEKPVLDEDKTINTLEAIMLPANDTELRIYNKIKGTVKRLVSLFKSLNIHSASEANNRYNDIVEHYNIEEPDEDCFQDMLFQTFKACIADTSRMDFNDQVYMPIHLGLNVPCFDQVILDEFQDTSELEMQLMGLAARGGQFCGLGDPDQSIYGFKGARPDAFYQFIKDMGAKELPLSICYRCPQSVIAEAQKIVPRIEAAPWAIAGVVDTIQKSQFHKNVKEKDFVLCRVTEHLVRECLRLIREGRKAKVRGRDIGNSLIALVNRVCKENFSMSVEKFLQFLFAFRQQRTAMLTKLRREREIESLEDRVQTVHALCENCSEVSDVIKRTSSIFCEDDAKHDGVDLMTIHKSKGLQSKRVWILRPDLLPHPRAQEREWMMAEEKRLKYVGITRAEEELYWVLKAQGER